MEELLLIEKLTYCHTLGNPKLLCAPRCPKPEETLYPYDVHAYNIHISSVRKMYMYVYTASVISFFSWLSFIVCWSSNWMPKSGRRSYLHLPIKEQWDCIYCTLCILPSTHSNFSDACYLFPPNLCVHLTITVMYLCWLIAWTSFMFM